MVSPQAFEPWREPHTSLNMPKPGMRKDRKNWIDLHQQRALNYTLCYYNCEY